MNRFYSAVIAAALCLAIAGIVRADGVFFAATATAAVYEKPAEIPAQRALIAFRDGKETLIVESAFSTESPNVGWIIPLPALPDNILSVSPGALKTLSFCLQPQITHYMPDWFAMLSGTVIVFFLLILYGLKFGFGPSRKLNMRSFRLSELGAPTLVDVAAVILIVFFLASLGLGSLGRGAGEARPLLKGVSVEQQVRVGSYEVTVLRVQAADDLNDWLKQSGFMSIPAAGSAIVADYIRDGWCFAAMKLERTSGGLSTPHPIRFDFAAKEAVYPMRLTALAGSSPQLELFIVADKSASSSVLAEEFCDSYKHLSKEDWHEDHYPAYAEGFQGNTYAQDIGHPDLLEILWDRCVITKLSGKLAPRQMKEDVTFSWFAPKPTHRHFFSSRGACVAAIIAAADLILPFVVVAPLFLRKRLAKPGGKKWFRRKLLFRFVLVVFGLGAAFYLVVPKTEVNLGHWRWLGHQMENFAYHLQEKDFNAASVEQVVKDAEEMLKDERYRKNAVSGDPIVREASPGNYDIRKEGGNIFLVYYDESGTEHFKQITLSETPN